MESFSLDNVDDDDFISDSLSSKSDFKRSFSVRYDNDVDKCTTPSRKTSETCNICGKNISFFNETRRLQHVNKCLDLNEQRTKFETKKLNYDSTVDCPLCKVQLPPGPFRISHLKKCSNEYQISVAQVLQLVKTQEQISLIRREKNLSHTKAKQPTLESCAPKKRKNKLVPKSVQDEQFQLALTLSMSENSIASDLLPSASNSTNGANCTITRQQKQITMSAPTLLQTVTHEEQLEKLQERLFSVINNVVIDDDMKTVNTEAVDKVGWWNMHRLSNPVVQKNILDIDNSETQTSCVESSLDNHFEISKERVDDSSPKPSVNVTESEVGECFIDNLISSSENVPVVDSIALFVKEESNNCSDVDIIKNNDDHNDSNGSEDMFEYARTSFTPDLFCNANASDLEEDCDVKSSVSLDETTFLEGSKSFASPKNVEVSKEIDDIKSSELIDKKSFIETDDFMEIPLAERIKNRKTFKNTSPTLTDSSPYNASDEIILNSDCDSNTVKRYCLTEIRPIDLVNCSLPSSMADKVDDFNNDPFISKVSPKKEIGAKLKKLPAKTTVEHLPKVADKTVNTPVIEKVLENNTFTIIKRANVTPMPEYDNLNSPELSQHLGKFGVKPMARRRAIPLLRKLYDETHPYVGDDGRLFVKEQDHVANAKRKRKTKLANTAKRLSCSQPIESRITHESTLPKEKKKKNVKEKPSLSQDVKAESSSGEDSDSDPIAEESFMPAENETDVEPKDISELLRQFFTTDVDLYRRVLKYEPFPLKEMHAKVKLAGIKCSLKSFIDFMDAQCITFTMKDERKAGVHFRTPKKGRLK